MAAERDKLGVEASELLSSLTTAEACLPSMPATMAAAGHNSSSGGEGLPGSGTVEQALGSASMPPQQGASGDIEQAARLKSVFQVDLLCALPRALKRLLAGYLCPMAGC